MASDGRLPPRCNARQTGQKQGPGKGSWFKVEKTSTKPFVLRPSFCKTMTRLILSVTSSERLRKLATADTGTDASPLKNLVQSINEQPPSASPTMNGSSAAVPDDSSVPLPRLVLDHTLLISLTKWAPEAVGWKLSDLVKGSEVYIPPKPKFERSKQLEDSLAAIRRAQEEAEYAQMSTSSAPIPGFTRPFTIATTTHTTIAGTDPSMPLGARIATQFGSLDVKKQKLAEEEEWKNVQRQLGVILNVFLSVMATATAAWWASGNADVATKVLVSLAVALITGLAEIVLYNRYQVYVTESRKYGKKRMTGSDVRKDFRPLNLSTKPTPS